MNLTSWKTACAEARASHKKDYEAASERSFRHWSTTTRNITPGALATLRAARKRADDQLEAALTAIERRTPPTILAYRDARVEVDGSWMGFIHPDA